jgi:hypothetical protein
LAELDINGELYLLVSKTAFVVDKRGAHRVLVRCGNLRESDYSEDIGVDKRIRLN